MRVMVTNDDGVGSRGLAVLAQVALDAGHETLIAAPNVQYSGASASLIGQQSDGRLLLSAEEPPGVSGTVTSYGVQAAPGLIVFAASYGAFGERPEVVLSGVNLGANTGHATLHSGTVGAALSAATQGIPAMAVSIASADPQHWETARAVSEVALTWLENHLDESGVLNVNVPDVPLAELRGLRTAGLAAFGAVQAQVMEKDEGYVTLTYSEVQAEYEQGTDAYLLARGWATVSLLHAPIHDAGTRDLPEFTTERGAQDGDAAVDVSAGHVMSPGQEPVTG